MIAFRATLTAMDIILAVSVAIYIMRKASDDVGGALWFVFCILVANATGLWL